MIGTRDWVYEYENDKIIVNDGGSVPSDEEIQAEETRLRDQYAKDKYKRQRARAFKKLNQWELQYDDMINGTNKWQEAVEAIKAKYPKPTE